MPITKDSRYVAVSTVLFKHQQERAEAVHRAMEAQLGGKVKKSEVYREIVEAGLVALSQASDSILETSTATETAA